jgi:hypothetical protein
VELEHSHRDVRPLEIGLISKVKTKQGLYQVGYTLSYSLLLDWPRSSGQDHRAKIIGQIMLLSNLAAQ